MTDVSIISSLFCQLYLFLFKTLNDSVSLFKNDICSRQVHFLFRLYLYIAICGCRIQGLFLVGSTSLSITKNEKNWVSIFIYYFNKPHLFIYCIYNLFSLKTFVFNLKKKLIFGCFCICWLKRHFLNKL